MLIIGIDPGITGSICFFQDGKIIDVIEMPNMPEGKKNKKQVNGAQVFNEKDLVDMPKKIIDEIKITPVEFADEVVKMALIKELKKTEWVEVDMSKKEDKSQASIQ